MATAKKQQEIAGTERKGIPELDKAIVAMFDARDTHEEAAKTFKDSCTDVQSVMNEHGVDAYTYVDGEFRHEVKLVESDVKLKVKRKPIDEE